MHTVMRKKNHYGKPLLCLLILLTWCCLMPTAAIGANEEVAAEDDVTTVLDLPAEDYVTTVLVLPLADRASVVDLCLKQLKLDEKECERLVGGYYAVISGDEFLVYAQPYDVLTLINMLEGLFDLGETSLWFETDISVITGLLTLRWENFETTAQPGTTTTIGSEGIGPPQPFQPPAEGFTPPPPVPVPPPPDPFRPGVGSCTTGTGSPHATAASP